MPFQTVSGLDTRNSSKKSTVSKNKIRAVIIYLSRSTPEDIAYLKLSLSLLDLNFNHRFRYPIVIFHEDFDEVLMERIRRSTLSTVHFERLQFKTPRFLNKAEIPDSYLGFSIGYRHMCRFFAGDVFEHPILRDYDWYWRLDNDSFILNRIDYDVFRFMQRHDFAYGYLTMSTDFPDVTKGLWDVTEEYIERNNIKPTFLRQYLQAGVWDRTYYYTNFEISRLDFWRSEQVADYLAYVDRTGGIYKYRWGDTAIHSLAIFMFMPERAVHQFTDIDYKHQDFVNQVPRFRLLRWLEKQSYGYTVAAKRRVGPTLKGILRPWRGH